jgi:hypothetical protein
MTYRNGMRFAWFLVLAAACGPDDNAGPCKDSLLAGDLVVTEVFADYAAPTGGTGTDEGKEWLEIYNNTDRAVSLKGVTVVHSRPDGSQAKSHVMADVTVAPGQYFTLGNSTSDLVPAYVDYGYSADLGDMYNTNGGMFALRCGDNEIDSAQYEMVRSGRSRQLSSATAPDYTTNDNLASWCEGTVTEFEPNNFGTPGEESDCAPVVMGQCSDNGTMRDAVAPQLGDLVISEVMPNPAVASDATGEWFEVYATKDVDLNGLTLDRAGDTAGAATVESATCLRVTAGSYAVFAQSTDMATNGGLPAAVVKDDFNFALIDGTTAAPGDVQILYGGTVLDAITWTSTRSGRSHQLDPDSYDVTANDSEASFCDATTVYNDNMGMANMQCPAQVQPGQCLDNGTPRAIVKPAAGALVISEIMPNPKTEGPQEWFEITNVGGAAFDLNGLGLDRDGDTSGGNPVAPNVVTIIDCASLAPGSYALFARSNVMTSNGGHPIVDATFGFSMVNGDGNVRVVDPATCSGNPIVCTTVYDSLAYTQANGWPATATADGVSAQLKQGMLTDTANDAFANFCPGTVAYGDLANLGTPRAVNTCP